jgi:hypothetical protein
VLDPLDSAYQRSRNIPVVRYPTTAPDEVKNTVAGERSSSVTADPENASRRATCTYVTSLSLASVVTRLPSHGRRRWVAV